jgi:sec-independent protein translocase protein TatC
LFQEGFSFSEHINELRARLRVIVLSLLVILIFVVFFPANPSYQFAHLGDYLNLQFLANTVTATFVRQVASFVLPSGWTLIAATGIGEPMEIYFIAALLLSLALDMPIIAYEMYKFVDPALNENERRMIYPFVASASVLFVAGLAFGYFVIAGFLVQALAPFFRAGNISYQIDAAAFYYVVFLIIGSTGVSFTSPVFVYTLIRLRIIEADFFSRNRVVIWFVIWVITGLFLTPDGGPLLDLVIFIPIVLLVEGAVWLARRQVRGVGPQKTEPRCPYCSAKLRPGQRFCPDCHRFVA